MTSSKLQKLISILAAFVILCGCMSFASAAEQQASFPAEKDGYKLKRIVIFSRHSIRAPLDSSFEVLDKITPHKWNKWTANPEELSLRGGIVETLFGQYFKQALEKIGFIPQNWEPDEKEVRFRSNSLQRTIATARSFASGFLPVANIKIEHKEPIGKSDPEINTALHFTGKEYLKQAAKDILVYMGVDKLSDLYGKLRDGLSALEKVLDYKKSKQAKESGSEHFPTDKLEIEVTEKAKDDVANVTGGLKLAVSAADALGLQYLESTEADNTFFGHRLSGKEVVALNSIYDAYYSAIYSTPSIAVNVIHPLLIYLKDELQNKDRRFSFTCGHFTNILSLVSALGVKPYSLKDTIGTNIAPIGCKIVFCVYEGPDGKEYTKVFMMYLSNDQIRKRTELSVSVPPMITELSFDGLEKNKDGYYTFDDLIKRFDEAIDAFWKLPGNSKDKSDKKAA